MLPEREAFFICEKAPSGNNEINPIGSAISNLN
jgi:hypothetical protein